MSRLLGNLSHVWRTRWIEPLDFKGVKLMSAGFAKIKGTDVSGSDASKTVLRGPMVSRLVQQLVEQVRVTYYACAFRVLS
jgi:hypothetical protein